MDETEQANLSLREKSLKDKDRIRLLGFKSPDYFTMFGLRINPYTIFFCSSPERRQRLAEKLPHCYGDYIDCLENLKPLRK